MAREFSKPSASAPPQTNPGESSAGPVPTPGAQAPKTISAAPVMLGQDRLQKGHGSATTSYQMNWPLVVKLVVILIIATPALYFWHGYQHSRHSDALLGRARKLRNDAKWDQAANTLHRYLEQHPDDAEALAERAEISGALANSRFATDSQKTNYLKQSIIHVIAGIKANPQRYDLQLLEVRLLLLSKRHQEALKAAEKLRAELARSSQSSADALLVRDADRFYAMALVETNPLADGLDSSIAAHEELLQKHPRDLLLTKSLIGLLDKKATKLGGAPGKAVLDRAHKLVDELLSAEDLEKIKTTDGEKLKEVKKELQAIEKQNRDTTTPPQVVQEQRKPWVICEDEIRNRQDALLYKLEYQEEELEKAKFDSAQQKFKAIAEFVNSTDGEIQDLLASDPENPRIVAQVASLYLRTGRQQKAIDLAEGLLKSAPEDPSIYLPVAAILMEGGQARKAIRSLIEGLERVGPDDFELNRMLLQAYLQESDRSGAEAIRKRIEPLFRKIRPLLDAPQVALLSDELQLADAQIAGLEGDHIKEQTSLQTLFVTAKGRNATTKEQMRRGRLLARAYHRDKQYTQAAETYGKLSQLDPTALDWYLAAASEYLSGDEPDVDRAISRLRDASAIVPDASSAWVAIAEDLRRRAVQVKDLKKVDWTTFDKVLEQGRKQLPNSAPLALYAAEAAMIRGQANEAKRILKGLGSREFDPFTSGQLAVLWHKLDQPQEADAVIDRLDELEKTPENARVNRTIALAKANLLAVRGETGKAVAILLPHAEQADPTIRNEIIKRVIEIELEGGAITSARSRLEDLVQSQSSRLWGNDKLADLAIVSRDLAQLEKCEKAFNEIEGDEGLLYLYCRAVRVLESSSDDSKGAVTETRELLAAMKNTLPDSSFASIVEGLLAEHTGRTTTDKSEKLKSYDLAISHFQKSIQAGDRHLTPLQHLVTLLGEQNRIAEALAYVKLRPEGLWLVGDLCQQEIVGRLNTGRNEEAIRLARAGAELRSTDPQSLLLLAQSLSQVDAKNKEAESLFRKATRLAPTALKPWFELLRFYARQKRMAEARETLDSLIAHVKLTPPEREFYLGLGTEAMGERDQAERHFLKALEDKKTDPRYLMELARFYASTNLEKTFEYWVQALRVDPKIIEPRRQLAVLCGTISPNDRNPGPAIELLGTGAAATAGDQQRFDAAYRITKGGVENWKNAAQSLTQVIDSSK
ncbi:MAG: hypothetical protein JSS02_25935, partial [Planctomycetes bacterium]|nr:hypothetical protein [Planctomycetota bacterium]